MASLKFRIDADAERFVKAIAERRSASAAEIVQRALEAYRFLHEVKDEDGEIVLRRKDGRFERLVRL